MREMIKKTSLAIIVLLILGGSAWAGWFTFEPNVILLDGTAVALKLQDAEKVNTYLEKGDTEHTNQLVKDKRVFLIKTGRDLTRVEFLDYEEHGGSYFVKVKDESGNELWANMTGVACEHNGKQSKVTKQDLAKGKFEPLTKVN
jgi:hypothetical protein